jgi:hypothetical protein
MTSKTTPTTTSISPASETSAAIKFPLGQLMGTPAALAHLSLNGIDPIALARRHQSGDFGDLNAGDVQANKLSVIEGNRILSAYEIGADRVYVITEADRSSTTILLASEY